MATCLLSFGATLVLVWLETIYFPTNEISSQVEMTGIDHGIKTKSVKNPAKDSEKLISNVLFENFDLASSKSPTRKLKNSNADFNNNAETASIDSIEKPRHTNFYDSILTLWTDIKQLSRMYWLLCLIIIFSYGTVIPFNSIHAGFLVTKFNMDPVTAGQIMAIPEGLSMILVSFTGAWVDKYGYRMQILQVCGM